MKDKIMVISDEILQHDVTNELVLLQSSRPIVLDDLKNKSLFL
ncbi:hypothetical protein AF72_05715 [Xylella taiwanensis]|uniref:Uncharacterized protein n=1 Tax=Xylella taiwanensis TaxID=1444770 RepID=Z9JKK1_9GAMM|nr:hypothetical protein AF72_05715 [Xylella taiwanensis]